MEFGENQMVSFIQLQYYKYTVLWFVCVCVQTAAPERPAAGLRSVFWQSTGSHHRLHRHQSDSSKDPVWKPHSRHTNSRVSLSAVQVLDKCLISPVRRSSEHLFICLIVE